MSAHAAKPFEEMFLASGGSASEKESLSPYVPSQPRYCRAFIFVAIKRVYVGYEAVQGDVWRERGVVQRERVPRCLHF